MLAAKPDKVIVRKDRPVAIVGNMHIPEQAQERPTQGVVIAAGRNIHGVVPGDRVLVEWRYGGAMEFSWQGEDYWLLGQKQILSKVE